MRTKIQQRLDEHAVAFAKAHRAHMSALNKSEKISAYELIKLAQEAELAEAALRQTAFALADSLEGS